MGIYCYSLYNSSSKLLNLRTSVWFIVTVWTLQGQPWVRAHQERQGPEAGSDQSYRYAVYPVLRIRIRSGPQFYGARSDSDFSFGEGGIWTLEKEAKKIWHNTWIFPFYSINVIYYKKMVKDKLITCVISQGYWGHAIFLALYFGFIILVFKVLM